MTDIAAQDVSYKIRIYIHRWLDKCHPTEAWVPSFQAI